MHSFFSKPRVKEIHVFIRVRFSSITIIVIFQIDKNFTVGYANDDAELVVVKRVA